jgi:hypothetical protein
MEKTMAIDTQTVFFAVIGWLIFQQIINQFGTYFRERLTKPDNTIVNQFEKMIMRLEHNFDKLTITVGTLSKSFEDNELNFKKRKTSGRRPLTK